MNVFERQANLFRELSEVQTTTGRSLADLYTAAVTQYFELNQDFAKRMPSGPDFGAWAELNREYGEAVWSHYREYLSSRGEIVKDAMDKTNDVYRAAFAQASDEAPAAIEPVAA